MIGGGGAIRHLSFLCVTGERRSRVGFAGKPFSEGVSDVASDFCVAKFVRSDSFPQAALACLFWKDSLGGKVPAFLSRNS